MDMHSSLVGIRNAFILMALVTFVEAAIPLYKRNAWHWRHLGPNLFLTLITFGVSAILNLGILAGLIWLETARMGVLNVFPIPSSAEIVVVLVALDFAWYLTHVSLHKSPWLWRFHAVHHSDPAVDVTTTYRQHPVESLVRYVFLAVFAFSLGASPAAFAFYRLWSVFAGQTEHANVRLPQWLDTAVSYLTMSPVMHKVHHSRDPKFTNTNYSQIFSLWDRIFGTVTPARYGRDVRFGLDGYDSAHLQSGLALLTAPLEGENPREGSAARAL